MSRRQANPSNTYSHVGHPKSASFPPRSPGWPRGPSSNGPHSRLCNGSDFSTCSGHSGQSLDPASPRLSQGRVCTGQPYNSRFVETSHLVRGPKAARMPNGHSSGPHYLLCTDCAPGHSSSTFLDQLIKAIDYLDQSTSTFYNCPQTLRPPKLAASYLDRLEHLPRSYSSHSATAGTCVVPSPRGANTLQCLDGSTSVSRQHPPQSQGFTPVLPQMSGTRLPELPLFGSGLLSHLPKVWEAIRSGWSALEPSSKSSTWW